MNSRLLRSILYGAAAATVVCSVYVLRFNSAVGLMIDDAAYMVLGKALADGEGYRLVSSPTAVLPSAPPGFPLLLALVFRLSPEFPQNIWLLKSISIAAMMGVGVLTFVYLRRDRQLRADLAAYAALATVLTPAFVFLATSTVMSECVFTLSQLATVVVIHRSANASSKSSTRAFIVVAAVLAAVTMLIRSAAIGLTIAAVLWWLTERRWRDAALFAAVVVVCLLPWTLYARANAPTAAERDAHGGAIAYTYLDQLSMRWSSAPHFGRITIGELPARLLSNSADIAGRSVAGVLAPVLFRGPEESGEEVDSLGPSVELSPANMGSAHETMLISSVLAVIALIGFVRVVRERLTVAEVLIPIALAIIIVWPYRSFRFVMPLTPFLLLYFVRGIQAFAPAAVRAVLLCVIGLHLYDHGSYLALARDPERSREIRWLKWSREVEGALDWINDGQLGADGAGIAASNPALLYLRTGRKAIPCDYMTFDWSAWRQRGVRYVVLLFDVDLPAYTREGYEVLYRSSGRLWVIKI